MKKGITILFALAVLSGLWAGNETRSNTITRAAVGNVPDGTYTIKGESSHRCIEVPNGSCRDKIGLQIFDCDPTDASNNQKFNVVSDGSGFYTIVAAHSDMCLEVFDPQDESRILVQQNVCEAGKSTQ